jgi:polysaccharide chain length determinant protein (PEP-CTERM system associated)
VSVRHYTLVEVWRLIVRHRWLILLPVAVGVALTPLLGRFAVARYRSEALLLVVPQQVPEGFVASTVTETVAERLPSITAQILSRSKLERIVLDLDLYKAERAREVMEDVVERMKTRDVQTMPVGKNVDSFRIAYVSDEPETARRVTERLASLYIEQNVRDRASQADRTSEFLATQLENTKQRLVEQEKKLEAYRKLHSGQLPSQLTANMQAIDSANVQLRAVHQSIDRAEENRLRLQKQIADLEMFPAAIAPVAPERPTTAQLLELERARLASLMEKYKPDHPDIASARRAVAELAAKVDNETPLSAKTPDRALPPGEAAQQRRLRDLQTELQLVERQLAQDRADEKALRSVIGSYQANVSVLPTRESELTELTREYNTMLTYYNSLVMKREDAAIAANLERRQIGEQFSLLDPASRPDKPYNELQRLGVLSGGAFTGLVLGLLLIALREYRDASFRSKDEVVKVLSLPVLATIPVMVSVRERRAAFRRMRALDIGGSALLLASVAIVVVWRLYS